MSDVNRSRRGRLLPSRAPSMARRRASLLVTVMLAALIGANVAHLDSQDVYALKDAQIVTGTGKTITKGTVVFRNGLIVEVGERVKIPADARVIDATGLTVYPGLIDGLTSLGFPAPAQGQRPGGGGAAQAIVAAAAAGQQPNPEAAHGDPSAFAADQIRPGGTAIEDERSLGVTSALTTQRQGIFAGQSAVINLAGDEPSKLIVRTPVALTVQFSTGPGFAGSYPNSLMGTVAFIRQSFYDAMNYRDEIERYNRVKRGVARPEHDKKLAALQPALKGDLPVLFLATTDGDIRRALMIADEFKLKPIIAGAMYGYRIADILKAKNVPVILSVDFPRRNADLPEDEDEPLRVLRDRAETQAGAARLARAGVKFAFMSGTLRPQDFIANVQRAVDNGLSRQDALRALTINAAEILGVADQLGTVEEGKIANLVVTSGDLLSREARVRHVFIDGREIELKRPEQQTGPGMRAGMRPGAPQPRTPAQAGALDPVGEWQIVVRTPQGDVSSRLTLRREGDQIVGRWSTQTGVYDIQNVTLSGNQLRFTASIQIQPNSDNTEAIVTGAIEGGTMRGVVQLPALGSFDFTGTRPR